MVDLKFWKKKEEEGDELGLGEGFESTDTNLNTGEQGKDLFSQPEHEMYKPPETNFQQQRETSNNRIEVIEIKVDGLKAKIEILEHKIDLILKKMDKYY